MEHTASEAIELATWGNAWLAGHVGLDDAVDAIEDITGPGVVAGLPGEPAELSLRHTLALLRQAGLRTLRLALPAPGDPLGLAGPADFNIDAIDAGKAVIAVGAGAVEQPAGFPNARPHAYASLDEAMRGQAIGLIPSADRRGSSYLGVRWGAHPGVTAPRDSTSLNEADHALTTSLAAAGERIVAGGQPAQWRPQVADALATLHDRLDAAGTLAPGFPGRAHRVAVLARRLATIIDVARADAPDGITAHQTDERDAALRDLDRAVRRARVAACHSVIR